MQDTQLYALAERIGARLAAAGQRLATAESCTGGWVAKAVTDIAGSSDWFECGLVTYSNRAKTQLLGVDPALIDAEGAVSRAVVEVMAAGLLQTTGVDWGIAVSGIAGPGGGSADKPVGTVWIGWAGPAGPAKAERFVFAGGREAVRRAAVASALEGLLDRQ